MTFRLFLLIGLMMIGVLLGWGNWAVEPTSASGPIGNISVDVSGFTNTFVSDNLDGSGNTDRVGPIGSSVSGLSDTCNDNTAGIFVELVIGDANTQDGGTVTGGIPAGSTDIAGWNVRLRFDPNVLAFIGFTSVDQSELVPNVAGALEQFYMEKASIAWTEDKTFPLPDIVHPGDSGNHISVDSSPGPGLIDIGSSIFGTPSGANGVGRIALVFFDCTVAGSGPGGTCIDIVNTDASFPGVDFAFYRDVGGVNHAFAQLNGAALGVNGGTAPASCAETEPTPTPTPTPGATPTGATPTPTPTPPTSTLALTSTPTPTPVPGAVLPASGGPGATNDTVPWGTILIGAGLAVTLISGSAAGLHLYRRRRRA